MRLSTAAAAATATLIGAASAARSDIVGTWSSGSGRVQTGQGFCTPQDYSFNVPATTGISYSFTSDGYYEEASYKFNSNASQPQCIQAVLIWQHGTYELVDNDGMEGIHTTPIAEDGRIQVEDPCAASSNVLTTTNITREFQKYLPFNDPVKDKQALQLYDFDGSLLAPMYLISKQPNMLPTGSITNHFSKRGVPEEELQEEAADVANTKRDVNDDLEKILETRYLERRKGGGRGGSGRVGGAGAGAGAGHGESSASKNTLSIALSALVLVAASVAII
ncbi:hypothetical protein E3P99_01313 [Wallemia hederae]|uniref:Uncharacterized protein n=1 Tax=Wallemia hederae TaxID=1540922 RepID=A0A4T0FR40_9BASI|nr:hypothetical protein E3P99_01313 [Wallemia hederae]